MTVPSTRKEVEDGITVCTSELYGFELEGLTDLVWGWLRDAEPRLRPVSEKPEVGDEICEVYSGALGCENRFATPYRYRSDVSFPRDCIGWILLGRANSESLAEGAEKRQDGTEDGCDLIARERARQIREEGWSSSHDDEHRNGELARAAACYAMAWTGCDAIALVRDLWPFQPEWWKPKDPISDLVRAGALIAAEIDRIKRVNPKTLAEEARELVNDAGSAFAPNSRNGKACDVLRRLSEQGESHG